jgi:hypothetical protein
VYLIREVMQCKPGKVKPKGLSGIMKGMGLPTFRIYTDVAGEHFWTVVAELEVETLSAFGEIESRVMSHEEAGTIMAGYHDLVASGRREIYKVEG